MKKQFKLPIPMMFFLVLVSCTTDSPNDPRVVVPKPQLPVDLDDGNGGDNNNTFNFGFLDGNSNTYIDMPIESSTAHLFIGRWQITKFGLDELNDGNLIYYHYQDYGHKDCGESFLQFNNDGVVFENNYYKNNNACTLYSNQTTWELVEENRFKIGIYDFIYLVEVTESELVLKYDWNHTHWGPMQTYYYYERIQESN